MSGSAEALPPFTGDPVARLRHVLAAFADQPADGRAITATLQSAGPGHQGWTGLTWGDLRALEVLLALQLPATRAHIRKAQRGGRDA